MIKRITFLMVLAVLAGTLLVFVPTAIASHEAECAPDGPLERVEIGVSGVATLYIDDRQFVQNDAGTQGGIWIYMESNGQPGLQRGGVSLIGESENCFDHDGAGNVIENPDTLIF